MIIFKLTNGSEFRLQWPKERMREIKDRIAQARRTDELISIDADDTIPQVMFPARAILQVHHVDDPVEPKNVSLVGQVLN